MIFLFFIVNYTLANVFFFLRVHHFMSSKHLYRQNQHASLFYEYFVCHFPPTGIFSPAGIQWSVSSTTGRTFGSLHQTSSLWRNTTTSRAPETSTLHQDHRKLRWPGKVAPTSHISEHVIWGGLFSGLFLKTGFLLETRLVCQELLL